MTPIIAMQSKVKNILLRLASLCAALLNRSISYRRKETFGILMYHRITDSSKELNPTINVTTDQFQNQLTELVQRGFVFWPLKKLIHFRNNGWKIPPQVTALTFDDGFAGVYHNGWPILKKLNIPATIFVNTAYLDSQDPMPFDHWGVNIGVHGSPDAYRPLTISQCKEMEACKLIDIGSHTHTHQDFRQRPRSFREDLQKSLQILQTILGHDQMPFALPYGIPRAGYADKSLIDAAKQTGVTCALNTGSELISEYSSPFYWGRFNVNSWDNGATLAGKLNGWYSWAPRLWNLFLKNQSSPPWSNEQSCSLSRNEDEPDDSLHVVAKKDKISVVVPTFNRATWLKDAIHTLIDQRTDGEFEYEIIVIDNCSTDNTPEVVEEIIANTSSNIRYYLELEKGDAPARNRGVKEAVGDWIAFFDDDQRADPSWLYELRRAALHLNASIVGGVVTLDLSLQKLAELHPYVRQILRETYNYKTFHPFTENTLPGTGNSMVEKRVFEQVGLFYSYRQASGADFDFFLRARKAGFALWFTPHAIIHHRIPESRLTDKYLRWESYSGGAMVAAHFDRLNRGLPALVLLCSARALKALIFHLPVLCFALLAGDATKATGHRIRLWRIAGYHRRTLSELFPRVFPQQRFFDSLKFRIGRKIEAATSKRK